MIIFIGVLHLAKTSSAAYEKVAFGFTVINLE
jgi:hypothetical protein